MSVLPGEGEFDLLLCDELDAAAVGRLGVEKYSNCAEYSPSEDPQWLLGRGPSVSPSPESLRCKLLNSNRN